MERVLVTGAGGYIGSSLVPMLLAEGYKVRALDRFFFGRDALGEHPQLERIQADSRRLEPALFEGVDHVIDLVAISNDPSGELFQDATWQINHEFARPVRQARQGGRGQALPPAVLLQHLRLPGPGGDLRREPPDQSADHLRPGQRDGRAGRAAARRRRLLRRGPAPGHGLRLQPAHALRSGDQRHDLRRLEDRRPAADARRQPVAPDGPRARCRERPDLHAPRTQRAGERPAVQRRLGGQQLPARPARRDDLRGPAEGGPDRLVRRSRPPLLPGRLRQDRGARLEGDVRRARGRSRDLREARGGRDRQDHPDAHPRVVPDAHPLAPDHQGGRAARRHPRHQPLLVATSNAAPGARAKAIERPCAKASSSPAAPAPGCTR